MKTFIFHPKIISVTCVSFISKDLKMIVLPKGNDWECGCAGILMYGNTVTQSWRLSRFLASRNSQSMGLTCICLNSWDPTMDTRPLHCDSFLQSCDGYKTNPVYSWKRLEIWQNKCDSQQCESHSSLKINYTLQISGSKNVLNFSLGV